jgi:Mg-chelatase subunit ChlI
MDLDLASARVLPFSAIVGQEELKLALLMLAVNPRLGGVLIRGEKGTAKSTAARGLASLLPPERANAGCRYGCPADVSDAWCDDCRRQPSLEPILRRPPFESLPLGVTEDQLLGSMDLEHALRHGKRRFSPGLLARVNRGVLYVDEVNLLEDHLVDLLLDVAAFGVNVVAREGVSVVHPSQFMLVGTMNPEEGELRPQLLDRFGLCTEVESLDDVESRAQVVHRRLAFEADPGPFRSQWSAAERELARQVVAARELLPAIVPDPSLCVAAARLSTEVGVHGHRSDLLLVKGAATIAALEGRTTIEPMDFERVAPLALRHRLRRAPFEEVTIGSAEIAARAREAVAAAGAADSKKKSALKRL